MLGMLTIGRSRLVEKGPRASSPAYFSVEAFDSAGEGDLTGSSRSPYSESSAAVLTAKAALPMEMDPVVWQ